MDKNELYKRLNLTPEDRRLDDENFAKVLKAKFRKASLQWHPDKHSGKSEAERKKAEEKFKEIAEAYEVLSDPQKRRQYDTFGTFDANASTMSGADINDIFTRFFDEGFFGGRGGPRRGECGTDKSIRIGVTLRELYGGKDKTVRFKKYVPCDACGGTGSRNGGEAVCPHCNGSGMITTRKQNGWMVFQSSSTCPHCNGTGTIMKDPCHKCDGQGIVEKEVEITVPVRDIMDCNGQRFMVQGEGNACFRGKGPNGDLYYTYRVIIPDEGFSIEEGHPYNLVADLDVPILTCLTGGEVDYRHIDGTLHKVKVERCATDGDRIVVRNLGLPKGYGRGDLVVVVHSVMPRRLTDSDIKLINELKKSQSFK